MKQVSFVVAAAKIVLFRQKCGMKRAKRLEKEVWEVDLCLPLQRKPIKVQGMKAYRCIMLPWLTMGLVAVASFFGGCSRDEASLAEVLPGQWYMTDFELVVDGDSDSYELSFDGFKFMTDGRVAVSYLYEPQVDTALYEAGNDYIRLEFHRDGNDRMELFQVLDFSATRIHAKYFNSTERDVEGTITLGRERPERWNEVWDE